MRWILSFSPTHYVFLLAMISIAYQPPHENTSHRLLAFLARRKEPARLLVIGTYRPVEMFSAGQPLQSLMQELYAVPMA